MTRRNNARDLRIIIRDNLELRDRRKTVSQNTTISERQDDKTTLRNETIDIIHTRY